MFVWIGNGEYEIAIAIVVISFHLPYEYKKPFEKTNALSISFSRSLSDKLLRYWMLYALFLVAVISSLHVAVVGPRFLCRYTTTGTIASLKAYEASISVGLIVMLLALKSLTEEAFVSAAIR